MFESFYGLSRTPFSRDIEVDKLYVSVILQETLGRLEYAAERQLFAVVTGDCDDDSAVYANARCGKPFYHSPSGLYYYNQSGMIYYQTILQNKRYVVDPSPVAVAQKQKNPNTETLQTSLAVSGGLVLAYTAAKWTVAVILAPEAAVLSILLIANPIGDSCANDPMCA
jgi:hypothetical protein